MSIKKTRTVCVTCHARCGAIVYSQDNKIIKIEGDKNSPHSSGMFCGSGLSQRFIHEDARRVLYPMKRIGERGSGEWERISWEEAMDTIAEKSMQIRDKYGSQAIVTGQGTGRTWNHWHIRLNSTLGIEGWSLVPTHVCLLPHIIPHALTMGVFTAGGADWENAKTMVVWGVSPTGFRTSIKSVLENKSRGNKLIVIDVRYTDIAKNADIFIRPRPGTDGALALGFMNVIITEELFDKEFVDKWTYGFDELAARVKDFPPERVEQITWVPKDKIIEAARLIGSNGPTSLMASLGVGCMHTNGIQNGRAVACLQGLLGHMDKPGGFIVNQAMGVMLDPRITLWDETRDWNSPDIKIFGGQKYPMYKAIGRSNWPNDVFRAVLTQKPWPVRMMVFIANDPLLCYEDPQLAYEALGSPNLEFIAVKDYYLSPTAQMADIVLPTADWSERDTIDEELFTNMVISTERAVDPPGECWDDWRFFLEWGKRVNPQLWPWKDEKEMVLWRLKEFYNLDLTWDEYVQKAYISTEIGGGERVYEKHTKGMLRPDGQPGFMTPTGRIEFKCPTMAAFGYDPLPDYTEPAESPISTPDIAKDFPLILTTGHRLYPFFHSAWTNIPTQRELEPYPFVLINPADAQSRGILDEDWVDVSSPRGKISLKARVSHEIGEGVVAVPRPGWRDPCPELGLPGYGWQGANPNILIPAEPADPGFGSSPMKSTLCQVAKKED